MVVSCADPGIFARGRGGGGCQKKKLIMFFRHQLFYSFKEGYEWFILNKTIFFQVSRFTGEGVQIFPGWGGDVNIELVNIQGGGGGSRNSGFAHAYDRSTCFFSEANPERQVFSCNGSFSIVTLQNIIR